MNAAHRFPRLALAGLLLTALTAHAAPPAAPAAATGTAAQVQALPAAQVAALQANFSDNRQLLSQQGGAQIYQAICQGCHMVQAQGAKGVGFYPALASNPKLAASAYPVGVVMNGLHGMPSFAGRLSNAQVAEVVNYVRTSFGNHFEDQVSADDVQLFRK